MTDRFRKAHWLRRNRASKRPEALIFIDTEAFIDQPNDRREQHTFRLAVGCLSVYDPFPGLTELAWCDFDTDTALWQWVSDQAAPYKRTAVVAHNMDYDARVSRAFYHLPRLGWTPEWCVTARSCTIFVFSRGEQRLTLLDNLNLFPMSLADLGQSVGLEKLHVDFTATATPELRTYCRRDVAIMVEAWRRWLDFLDRYNLGDFGFTIAKQSFNAYRHRFMPCKIDIHGNPEAIELERAAYRGGRCQPFFLGKLPPGTYYKLDANGLYSAMMSWYPYPRRLVKVLRNVQPHYLAQLLKTRLVIAEVVLSTNTPRYPVEVGGRNAYPTGTFITTLTTAELELALFDDEVRAIGRVAVYEPADLFGDYIGFFTPLRQEYKVAGDFARSKMCKRVRNSLPGKFGQRGYKQERIGAAPLDKVAVRQWIDAETGQTATDLTFGGAVIRQTREGEAFDSFPAIPAHVNAYGRLYMWSLIEQAGRRNVYYMDTDSLIVNREGLDRLEGVVDPLELGYLKLEGEATQVELKARKDYVFGGRVVLKGVRKSAEQVSEDVYDQWHFTTLRYAFASQCLEGVTLRKVRKELQRGLVAGKVGSSGWVTPPHLTLAADKLVGLAQTGAIDHAWTWEMDPQLFNRLATRDQLSGALALRLEWAEKAPWIVQRWTAPEAPPETF